MSPEPKVKRDYKKKCVSLNEKMQTMGGFYKEKIGNLSTIIEKLEAALEKSESCYSETAMENSKLTKQVKDQTDELSKYKTDISPIESAITERMAALKSYLDQKLELSTMNDQLFAFDNDLKTKHKDLVGIVENDDECEEIDQQTQLLSEIKQIKHNQQACLEKQNMLINQISAIEEPINLDLLEGGSKEKLVSEFENTVREVEQMSQDNMIVQSLRLKNEALQMKLQSFQMVAKDEESDSDSESSASDEKPDSDNESGSEDSLSEDEIDLDTELEFAIAEHDAPQLAGAGHAAEKLEKPTEQLPNDEVKNNTMDENTFDNDAESKDITDDKEVQAALRRQELAKEQEQQQAILSLTKQLDELQDKYETETEQHNQLKGEHASLINAYQHLQSILEQKTGELNRLQEQLNMETSGKEDMLSSMTELQTLLEEFKSKNIALEEHNEAFKNQLVSVKNEKKNIEKNLKTQLLKNSKQINELMNKLQDYENPSDGELDEDTITSFN
jgi:chromosome segregation ATPase